MAWNRLRKQAPQRGDLGSAEPAREELESAIAEVGSGPLETLAELLALVPKRSEDEEPPTPIPAERWFPKEADVVVDVG